MCLYHRSSYLLVGFLLFLVSTTLGQEYKSAPEELGQVTWLRDYDEALARAKVEDKPILILFQEVPGCATCRNYGNNVLSHPLLVDAIDNEFIPLAIYNNKGGKDRYILDKYSEPSWNNPVIRITDSSGNDVLRRLSGNYSAAGLVLHMSLALRKLGKGEPAYLALLKEELTADNTETAYYKMYCFWSGESHIAAKDGVVATEPGWMGGHEVVKVVFDKDQLSKKELDKHASKASCVTIKQSKDYRIDKDPQYYLKRSKYRFLPLSPMQKSKINSALAQGKDPVALLSPTQRYWLANGTSSIVLYHKDLTKAWKSVQ